jgi:hypothetical protein
LRAHRVLLVTPYIEPVRMSEKSNFRLRTD